MPLEFLSRWHLKSKAQGSPLGLPPDDTPTSMPGLPFPAVTRKRASKWKGGDLQLVSTANISNPIPRSSPSSLTGFDVSDERGAPGQWQYQYQYQPYQVRHPQPSPTRPRPSSVAWVDPSEEHSYEVDADQHPPAFPTPNYPRLAPPAVIRLPSQTKLRPIARSVSLSPTPPAHSSSPDSPSSSSSFSAPSSQHEKWHLKLNTNSMFSQSSHSLRLDRDSRLLHNATANDVYGSAYSYPLAKQLSPIVEQDYFSPTSLRGSTPFLGRSGSATHNASAVSVAFSVSNPGTNPSPGGSQTSEIARPSPSYSTPQPFVTRQLNRTISQTSSRTHVSTSSSIPARPPSRSASTTPAEPPTIPPLNLTPPFPGPHPSREGPPLRPRRSVIDPMPTIAGSSESAADDESEIEEGDYGEDDLESLHAESFVTASGVPPAASIGSIHSMHDNDYSTDIERGDIHMDIADVSQATVNSGDIPFTPTAGTLPSAHSGEPSITTERILQRWERDAGFGSGSAVVTFRTKRHWLASTTPAFWAFWLGFICPFLWFVGGWHFTHLGEQPPKLSVWEFYFARLCCRGKRLKDTSHGAKGKEPQGQARQARLPRWVTEKQSSDDGRMRVQDPKRSLRGISFGYPFVPRRRPSVDGVGQPQHVWRTRVIRRIGSILETPNRLFDYFYGVRLREVRGRPESVRRVFDPWIQRCRYAFCYALIFLFDDCYA
ncbi:hypothetical protein DXG03_007981 [Asterophora parasitica]|uniref:Uncharacterized protein n=1 Tax=Asterophora parasitica TaxID=117018 RepID=A0A9P7KAJ6_9AGAR|nr:hypothetical protein DXG03_007981 [Asterophora parasitica]